MNQEESSKIGQSAEQVASSKKKSKNCLETVDGLNDNSCQEETPIIDPNDPEEIHFCK